MYRVKIFINTAIKTTIVKSVKIKQNRSYTPSIDCQNLSDCLWALLDHIFLSFDNISLCGESVSKCTSTYLLT